MKTRILLCSIVLTAVALYTTKLQAQCQASFTFTVNSNTVTLTNTSVGTGTPLYDWYFWPPYDSILSNNPFTVKLAANGMQQVCLSMQDSLSGCQSMFCDSFAICNANFSFVDSHITNETEFHDNSSYHPVSWSWSFGDGDTSTLQNPIHLYLQPGTYQVCLTIVDLYGDTCTCCKTISHYPCNISAFFTMNTSGDPHVTFTNTSIGGYKPSYTWGFGDGTYDWGTNAVHTYSYSGTYMVCLNVYDSLNTCSSSSCDSLKIVNAPQLPCTAQFYTNGDTNNVLPDTAAFYDYSTGNPIAWSWTFGDGGTSTLQNPTHQYAASGTYWVCLTATTANTTCSTCDSMQCKKKGAGVHELNIVSRMQNYPNPFYKTTTIKYTLEKNSNVKISVYDRIGSKVAELENSDKSAGPQQLEWNAETLSEGIYFLEVKANNAGMTKKLVLINK